MGPEVRPRRNRMSVQGERETGSGKSQLLASPTQLLLTRPVPRAPPWPPS